MAGSSNITSGETFLGAIAGYGHMPDGIDVLDELESHFLTLAKNQIEHRGHGIDNRTEEQILEMVKHGVARMDAEGVKNNPQKIRLAQKNLIKFIDALSAEAGKRGFEMVDAGILERVRERMCPIWPFC